MNLQARASAGSKRYRSLVMEGRAERRRLEYSVGGDLVDLDSGAAVTHADLVEHVRGGGRFVARDRENGKDVTLVVLARMLGEALPSGASDLWS